MADLTDKLGLRLAVSLFTVTASRTRAACVARVNVKDAHARNFRLVFREISELPKSPIGMLSALGFPSLSPLANACQFLHGNRLIRAFGFLNELLGNAVIYITLMAALATTHLFEFTLGGARADLLQRGAAFGVPLALSLYQRAAITLTIAVCRYVDNSKVNAEHIINVGRLRLRHFAHGEQIEVALAKNKVRFAHAGFKQSLLTRSLWCKESSDGPRPSRWRRVAYPCAN